MVLYILLFLFIFSLVGLIAMTTYQWWGLKVGKVRMPEREDPIVPFETIEKIASYTPPIKKETVRQAYEHIYAHGKKVIFHVYTKAKDHPANPKRLLPPQLLSLLQV